MLPYFLIIISAALWGTMGIYYRGLSAAGFGRFEIMFIRFAASSLIMLVWLLLRDRDKLKLRLRDLWIFLGSGVMSIFLMSFAYYTAIDLTSVAVAAVLLYTAPVFVTVMSVFFFRDRLTPRKTAALLLTVPGCALVSGIVGGGGYPAVGVLMGLLSGFAYALYTIFSRAALNRGYASLTISFYTFLLAGIAAACFCRPLAVITRMFSSVPSAAYGISVGLLTGAPAYLLYTKGLEKVPNSEASVIATVEPLVAAVLSLVLFREPMTLLSGLGMVLILCGVVLINVGVSANKS